MSDLCGGLPVFHSHPSTPSLPKSLLCLFLIQVRLLCKVSHLSSLLMPASNSLTNDLCSLG